MTTEKEPTTSQEPIISQEPTISPAPSVSPGGASSAPKREDRWRRPLVGPFTVAQVLAVFVAIVFTGVALAVLTSPLADRPTATDQRPGATAVIVGPQVEGLRIGDQAPEFTGTNSSGQTVELLDLDGNAVRLADFRGRPVWINFWATWCPPCQEELPILREMHEKYADDGLALVGISVQESTPADVRAYADRYDLNYTIGFDGTSAIFHTYHAFVMPTQIFLDRDGKVSQVILGRVTRAEADAIIAGLLAE